MKTVDAVEAAAAAAEAAAAAAASGLVAAEGSKTDEAPSADSPIADTATAGFVLDVVAFPAARVQGVGALSACLEKSRSRRSSGSSSSSSGSGVSSSSGSSSSSSSYLLVPLRARWATKNGDTV